ncbi:MAG: hypothetical protein LQ347_004533 [Umbilicaria vellea]|nr:MAG: hypothetical protein LQ347_004533 [Umbilicaria vellea]
MAKHYGKAEKLSDSSEIPFKPNVFQVTSSEPMPIDPPDTSSLTAMPELFPPTVIAKEMDWRQHPKWKPLISTPSRSTPIPKGTLVPDPSPARTFSDGENSVLMDPSPAGSYIHRRRQGEYVKRPPIWSLVGLGGEKYSHLLDSKDPRLDTSSHGEDIPFPLQVSTNLPVGRRQISKGSLTVSDLKTPSFYCEDQLNQMATAFTMDPFIVNVAHDMTYTNLSMLESRIGEPSAGPIVEQWIRNTPPSQEKGIQNSCQYGRTGVAVDRNVTVPSDAVLPSVNGVDRSDLQHSDGEAPIESTGTVLPAGGQVIRSNSKSPDISVGGSASALRNNENENRRREHIERPTESDHANQSEPLTGYRDIRTAPPIQGEAEYVHWIVLGSPVSCVNATTIVAASDNDDRFELRLGHQYLVAKIFDDQWALCIRCDIRKNLKLHQHDKLGKSIRKKLMFTLRSKPEEPAALPHMEKVEYDRNIINFLPLCAVTLATNYAAYLEVKGSTSSATNSPASDTRVVVSQRSPPEGGIVQAPERDSSQKEAVKLRKDGFVELPEHIFIASQVGPHRAPSTAARAIRNDLTVDPNSAQQPDGQDTSKQPLKSLGRFVGKTSVRGKKAWKDATQRLRRSRSFGDLLGQPKTVTQVQPAARAFQTEDNTTHTARGQASEAISNDLPYQAAEASAPRAADRGQNRSGESREPLLSPLSPNIDAIAATSTTPDGANDDAQPPTTSHSLATGETNLQITLSAATTAFNSEQQGSHVPAPTENADLRAPATTSDTLAPSYVTHEATTVPATPFPSRSAQPAPSPRHAGTLAPTPTPNAPHEEWATYGGDQPIPNFSHVEFVGEPDSFFDLAWAWGLVSGLNDPAIHLPR